MVERDKKTKKAFIKYIKNYPQQRFFQAVYNFMNEYISSDYNSLCAVKYKENKDGELHGIYEDTFFWECDEKLDD